MPGLLHQKSMHPTTLGYTGGVIRQLFYGPGKRLWDRLENMEKEIPTVAWLHEKRCYWDALGVLGPGLAILLRLAEVLGRSSSKAYCGACIHSTYSIDYEC